jgi:hypothetical protein
MILQFSQRRLTEGFTFMMTNSSSPAIAPNPLLGPVSDRARRLADPTIWLISQAHHP